MSSPEEREQFGYGALRDDIHKLSANNGYHNSTRSFEIPKPTQRESELGTREIQELQGVDKYEPELPQSRMKCLARPTDYDSNHCNLFHNVLNPGTGLALPQFKNKRTPYASHLDSYQIHRLLNPTRGIRDEMARKGITPRNHHKANIAAIAMKSAKLHNSRNGITDVDLPDGRTSRLRNSRNGFSELNGHGERCETPDNASVATESKSKKNPPKIDFLARNIEGIAAAVTAGRKKMSTSANAAEQKLGHENYGKVPAYLSQRKLELSQDRERRVQEEKEKHLPPGLVLMKNEERLEVLKTLENNKEKLVNKLSAMPLVLETPSQIRGKADVDAQLKEVEESIKRFSRPRVYIRYDN